ncbi:acyl-CoA dehydrogenase family protein [Sneathiella sp.]|uniref:acyl-CoA dehydrogenase family protein n=1 Tax=Sneathiella sp. TaxID=1964365 RepID=UPI00261A2CC4|nr:acyl-CoA dehydrogenase family protein [Sneathiella sp.]MDF2367038.1 acyl-CoA dehydrogenase family protein [Sneathiella sp.]
MAPAFTNGEHPFDFEHRYQCPYYTEDHRAWRATLREFIEREIMPHVNDWEEAGEFPRELYKKAGEVGLLGLGYPEEFGGTPVDNFFNIVTSEEMARIGAGGINASLMVHSIGLPPVLATGSAALKQRIAPSVLSGEKIHALAITEPSGGSDVANIKTRAEADGDDYLVNGSKMFITGGMRADYYTVAVRTGGEGRSGISLLLIERERPGFTRTSLKKQGWWASDTAALYFDDVRVPKSNLIGEENKGFVGIMSNFNSERLGMAAGANAFARVCLEDALAWARERKTFGQRLADHQVIRHKFSEMARKINATQAYLEQCAFRVQSGERPVADLSLLKVQATQTMEFCAREAMQVLGGAGYMRGCRVERIYREVRVMAIGGGSEEIMRDLVARQMEI